MTLFVIKETLDFPRGGPTEGHGGLHRDLSSPAIANSINKVVNYVPETMYTNFFLIYQWDNTADGAAALAPGGN